MNKLPDPHVVAACNRIGVAAGEARDEALRQVELWGPNSFHSFHEVKGVLDEEVEEFFEEVRLLKPGPRAPEHLARLRKELIQIAAVAVRAASDLTD